MDDGGPTASILLFFALLILDAAIYGFGSAIQNLNLKEEERKALEENNRKSTKLCRLIHGSESYANMVQVIITVVNLIAGSYFLRSIRALIRGLVENAMQGWAENITWLLYGVYPAVTFLLAILLILYILLVFGVLVPKKLAARSPEKWAYALISFVWGLKTLLTPFTALVTATSTGVLRLCGIRTDDDRNDVTEDEIISMVNEGHEQGVIQASEAQMITNIFEFGDKEATDIMTNRRDIVAIDSQMSFGEAVEFMLNGSNSRYPVYEENIDHIIGVLHLKDALRKQKQIDFNKPLCEIPDLLRNVRFIPETRKIDALFKTMQSMKQQMVIVVDEYGQTSGLIAMEDILEEIVGNILDEYDDEEIWIEEKGQNEYVIDGKTRLEDLEERFEIEFDEESFETINGFLIAKLEHIPLPDEQFDTTVDGYNFKILTVENKMISQVLVTRLPEAVSERKAEKEAKEKTTEE